VFKAGHDVGLSEQEPNSCQNPLWPTVPVLPKHAQLPLCRGIGLELVPNCVQN